AIRPAGYFRQKARRLACFARWYINRYGGVSRRMFRAPWRELRQELLELHGIGPETADAMLLYAGGQPVVVVDAYTKRIFHRHWLISSRVSSEQVRHMIMEEFPAPAAVYNEFHALLVEVGKRFCHRRDPDCHRCPLGTFSHRVR
ncbi:MAG: endonuclease III domain-containing protein, partial [Candidatus Omnitrophica bacterium]|nr:endonuclease III domain-containing protein [Candidatus Omnitrophota bacterium]